MVDFRITNRGSQYSGPKFSGYRIDEQKNQVKPFLPARAPANNSTVLLQYQTPPDKQVRETPLHWDGKQWVLPSNITIANNGLSYRFVERRPGAPDKIILDDTQIKDGFNAIPPKSADPSSFGPTLLVLPESVADPAQLNQLLSRHEAGDNVWTKRTHFNRLGGSSKSNEILREIARANGIRLIEDRPIIGGDNISSHGYWTTSLFQLNNKIFGPSGFDDLALARLEDGSPMCFDGAFVNEGFNGVHYLANAFYSSQSPFMDWFDYGKLDQFPYKPLKLGILPVDEEGNANPKAWDIRFIPPANPRNPEGPYWVETYDPRIEDQQGNKNDASGLIFTNSQDSVQNYRFPIAKAEYTEKKNALEEAAQIQDPAARAKALQRMKSQWRNFEFTASAFDHSGYNWDGQRDVKKLNMDNPEVITYIRNACTYWTDKVDRLYTRNVAKTLTQTIGKTTTLNSQDVLQAVNAITKNSLEDNSPNKILPAFNRGESNPVTADSIQKALQDYKKRKEQQDLPAAKHLVKQLADNFHLETLPAPTMMQALFATPRLKQLIQDGNKPLWLDTVVGILQPIFTYIDNTLFPEYRPCEQLMQLLTVKSFSKQLELKFESSLTSALKEKLRDPVLGHLFYEEIGRSVYLSLMTGKFIPPTFSSKEAMDKALDPNTLAQQYARTIPAYITNAPPNQAVELFNQFLIEKLEAFDTAQLNPYLEKMFTDITPESAVVAQHVLHQRKLGLHWRIDALKDMGDIDAVRAQPDALKTQRLTDELKKVRNIMEQVAQGVRGVFPTSVIKAEITDLHMLVSETGEARDKKVNALQEFLMSGLINGIPNYTWMFSSAHKAVAAASRPDGEGEVYLSPASFIQQKLKPMMQALPMEQALLFQNMTSNHDKSTSVHGLVLHPHQTRFDYYSWFGLNYNEYGDDRGAFHLALNELQYKPQLGLPSQKLSASHFDRLRTLAKSEDVLQKFSPDVAPYLKHVNDRPEAFKRATPTEVKRRYIDELFAIIRPEQLKLSQEQHQQLREDLKSLLLEPSETKALRGKLSNAFQQLLDNPQPLAQALGWDAQKTRAALNELKFSPAASKFDEALWKLSLGIPKQEGDKVTWTIPDKHRRWIGYQQIDYVIDWATQLLPESTLTRDPKAKIVFKQALYNETVKQALEQFKRIAALQTAVPGDPAFYLPDLLGQAGGEDLKNMYLGNRELVRYDWLKTNPVIQRFFEDLTRIIRQRYENHVLNNGHLELPLDPTRSQEEGNQLNSSTVIPMIRDNGTDQAICLVNLGKPDDAWQSWMNSQKTNRYPEIISRGANGSSDPTVYNYKLDLKNLGVPVGTVYKSAKGTDPEGNREEYYVVNADQKLVRQDNPNQGIDIRVARTLVRV